VEHLAGGCDGEGSIILGVGEFGVAFPDDGALTGGLIDDDERYLRCCTVDELGMSDVDAGPGES
jgi:hypothetical protein